MSLSRRDLLLGTAGLAGVLACVFVAGMMTVAMRSTRSREQAFGGLGDLAKRRIRVASSNTAAHDA